ncbi:MULTISPECIES: hypothetical protein [Halorussus]|uniref:hypothetical protein n=1 Tax=Halorussus TaxID=1070314 RepID=UPI00209E7CB5|nr:hypothetical protein [Halorussus vallis]USZ74946.1 hypothetical protein NGM07_16085 [Halorussus vallis]
MSGRQRRFNGDPGVLHRRAVRTPLPDARAERTFHENMMNVADAREKKAELLADPDVTLLEAYERELDRVARSFERRLRRVAGDDYREVAAAYYRGERDDRTGALASYYLEGLWRIQQRTTVTDMLFFPVILRYPDSFTVNVRFASGYATTESVRYESPEHSTEELDAEHARTYYEESNYSQRRAAAYLRDTAEIIREEFPDPDETSFEERAYGGIVSAGGRRGSVFSAMLKRVDPDPDRFSESVDEPVLVAEGREARRTERELLADGEVLL